MGNETSKDHPASNLAETMPNPRFKPVEHQGSTIQICCITFNWSSLIQLTNVPSSLIPCLRSEIVNTWDTIRTEKDHHGGYQFELNGNPWETFVQSSGESSVKVRHLLISLLICMAKNGWNIIQSCDYSRMARDKDALFFEYHQPDPDVCMFALSFRKYDRMLLIGSQDMMHVLKETIAMHTKIKEERDYHGAFEIQLHGQPWYSYSDGECSAAKVLLCQIIANFKAAGYKLYGSFDMSSNPTDLENWIFRKITPLWN